MEEMVRAKEGNEMTQCTQLVWRDGLWAGTPCHRKGVVTEGGKPWCRQHAPLTVKARNTERERKYKEKWDAVDERDAAPAREIKRLRTENAELRAALEGQGRCNPDNNEWHAHGCGPRLISSHPCRPHCQQARDALSNKEAK
jgi:hypothetical protein